MRVATITAFITAFSIIPMSATTAAEIDTQFRQITLGMERHVVIALMGSAPDAEMNANTLAISHSRMAWTGQAGRSYVIVTILDRVIRMKTCSGIPVVQC